MLLSADVVETTDHNGSPLVIVHFGDAMMNYDLYLFEATNSVFLAADPRSPIQGLPFFEITLPCVELAPCARGGLPTGLGIYAGVPDPTALWFSITRREDGNISLSGSYPGICCAAGLVSGKSDAGPR